MEMYPVRDKNHQLLAVGYEPVDGMLAVQFAKGQGEHRGVPEDKFIKLRRALYPYRQYKLTVQGQYPYTRIEDPVEKPGGESNGKARDVQDAAGRDCDSGDAGRLGGPVYREGLVCATDGRQGADHPSHALLPDGRRDAQSTGGRVRKILEWNCSLWE